MTPEESHNLIIVDQKKGRKALFFTLNLLLPFRVVSLLRNSHTGTRINEAANLKQSEIASTLNDEDANKRDTRENTLLRDILIFFDE